eukprot:1861360-Alexandrium_andersonii.AAC.1
MRRLGVRGRARPGARRVHRQALLGRRAATYPPRQARGRHAQGHTRGRLARGGANSCRAPCQGPL